MTRSARQRRVIAAAEALAEALAEADLKPSEMLDVGAALDRGCRRLSTRANAMDQLAIMFRTDAVISCGMTAGMLEDEG